MKIEIEKNVPEFIIKIEGKIDTESAPSLDKEIRKIIEKAKKICFDFAKVDYITSAGLRVILATSKEMKIRGEMTIINTSPTIKEIFDMTGFSEVVEID